MEKMRKKIKLMNLLLISYGKSHPFIGLGLNESDTNFIFQNKPHEEDIYEDNKDEVEIRENEIIDGKSKLYSLDEQEKNNVNYEQIPVVINMVDINQNEENEIFQRRNLIMQALEKRLIPLEESNSLYL